MVGICGTRPDTTVSAEAEQVIAEVRQNQDTNFGTECQVVYSKLYKLLNKVKKDDTGHVKTSASAETDVPHFQQGDENNPTSPGQAGDLLGMAATRKPTVVYVCFYSIPR